MRGVLISSQNASARAVNRNIKLDVVLDAHKSDHTTCTHTHTHKNGRNCFRHFASVLHATRAMIPTQRNGPTNNSIHSSRAELLACQQQKKPNLFTKQLCVLWSWPLYIAPAERLLLQNQKACATLPPCTASTRIEPIQNRRPSHSNARNDFVHASEA